MAMWLLMFANKVDHDVTYCSTRVPEYLLTQFGSHSKIIGFLGGMSYLPISQYDATLSGVDTFIFNMRPNLSFRTMR